MKLQNYQTKVDEILFQQGMGVVSGNDTKKIVKKYWERGSTPNLAALNVYKHRSNRKQRESRKKFKEEGLGRPKSHVRSGARCCSTCGMSKIIELSSGWKLPYCTADGTQWPSDDESDEVLIEYEHTHLISLEDICDEYKRNPNLER